MQSGQEISITGLVAAVHTPLTADGQVNVSVIERQAEHLIQQEIGTAFVCGSTGESHSLTLLERKHVAARWAEVVRGTPLQLIVHVGSNCLVDAADLARHAQQIGACAIAALAPSYFKPADVSALVRSMAEVAHAAVDLPFYFYDIPALTNVRLSMPEFLEQAAEEIPNLVGLKFTNEDFTSLQLCLAARQGTWSILWGVDESLLAALAMGVRAAVGSSYALAAPIYHRMMAAFEQGDWSAARTEQRRAVQLILLLAGFGYLPASKAMLEMLGVPVGPARLPLGQLSPADITRLRQALEQHDLLAAADRS